MWQKLTIIDIKQVSEPEPFSVEIVVELEGGDKAVLRMNAPTAQSLLAGLGKVACSW